MGTVDVRAMFEAGLLIAGAGEFGVVEDGAGMVGTVVVGGDRKAGDGFPDSKLSTENEEKESVFTDQTHII